MRVHGDVKPPEVAAGSMPNKPGRAWVRICLNAKQDEHGWVYDEYVTEVANGADLQERVTAQADALLLQAVGEEYGTPLTSVIFAMEVITVGVMHYSAIVPCIISALVAAGKSADMDGW